MAEVVSFPEKSLERLLPTAFEEDVGHGDITSEATISRQSVSQAVIVAKEAGVISGLPCIPLIFRFKNYQGEFRAEVEDGQRVRDGELIYTLRAKTRQILVCERILLNFLQRMCGIATRAHDFQALLRNTRIKILDSRKTLPGFRRLDKYAVRVGGGGNHRMGLYDAILIKDNHIQACGGVRQAVDSVFERHGSKYIIEAEVGNLRQIESLLDSPVNWVMLDNMAMAEIERAIALLRRAAPQIKIEASGNMDPAKVKELASLDLDFISVGALTHSVRALDISLKFIETM